MAEVTPEQSFAARVLDRLAHEERKLMELGLVNQAAGVRTAIVAVLKELDCQVVLPSRD